MNLAISSVMLFTILVPSQFQLLNSWLMSAFRHPTFSRLICSSALDFFVVPVGRASVVRPGDGFLCCFAKRLSKAACCFARIFEMSVKVRRSVQYSKVYLRLRLCSLFGAHIRLR
jgi:hypothetical protein